MFIKRKKNVADIFHKLSLWIVSQSGILLFYISIKFPVLQQYSCRLSSGHMAQMMNNMNAQSHFFMPIKNIMNGWQVGHWSVVRTCSGQILNCVVPAPQNGKLQPKTICSSKDSAPLPWEPLKKTEATQWLCCTTSL